MADEAMLELTPENAAIIDQTRDDWLRYSNSTEKANRPETERGIRMAYEAQGLPAPNFIFWVDSPYAGAFTLGIMPAAIEASRQLVKKAMDDVNNLPTSQALPTYKLPQQQINPDLVRDWWRNSTYGQHSAGYFAYLDALRRVGVPGLEKTEGAMIVAENSGWWWPAEEFSIVTERPNLISRDEQGRLHGESGPCIRFPDGWSLYAWHGTWVPKELIQGKWTAQDILREENTEIRRCAIEKMGWDVFIAQAKLTKVGATMDDPGNPGHSLELFDVPDKLYDAPVRVLLCDNATEERDGTRRRFGLTVPKSCANAIAAAAWTFQLTEAEYRTLQRAC